MGAQLQTKTLLCVVSIPKQPTFYLKSSSYLDFPCPGVSKQSKQPMTCVEVPAERSNHYKRSCQGVAFGWSLLPVTNYGTRHSIDRRLEIQISLVVPVQRTKGILLSAGSDHFEEGKANLTLSALFESARASLLPQQLLEILSKKASLLDFMLQKK